MQSTTKNFVRAGFLTAVLAASSASWAAPTIYFGENLGLGENTALTTYAIANTASSNFLASLSGVGTETFESYSAGTSSPLTLGFAGAGTATLSGAGNIQSVPPGSTNGVGRYGISGSQFWNVQGIFNIAFSNPVAAFGFYGIDIGDFGGQVTVTTTGSGGSTTYTVNNTLNGSGGGVLFWGIIDVDSPFTSISFGNTAPGTDVFAFDNMTIGSVEQVVVNPNPVPEPGSLALLGLGLAGLASIRRRKLG